VNLPATPAIQDTASGDTLLGSLETCLQTAQPAASAALAATSDLGIAEPE
jgi:hypothetical protein